VKPLEPIFDLLTLTWEDAAQEAAFEGRCFCMLDSGRIINSAAMPCETPHWNSRKYQSAEHYARALGKST
jgi:hypothetical protein